MPSYAVRTRRSEAVTGIVLAATGFAAKNDYDKNPTAEGADKVDRHALTADVAFINAVLFGASGLIWWLGNRPSDPKALAPTTSTAPRAFIAPRMGVTGGTFDAGFTFEAETPMNRLDALRVAVSLDLTRSRQAAPG